VGEYEEEGERGDVRKERERTNRGGKRWYRKERREDIEKRRRLWEEKEG
jgi:hypothetical protein